MSRMICPSGKTCSNRRCTHAVEHEESIGCSSSCHFNLTASRCVRAKLVKPEKPMSKPKSKPTYFTVDVPSDNINIDTQCLEKMAILSKARDERKVVEYRRTDRMNYSDSWQRSYSFQGFIANYTYRCKLSDLDNQPAKPVKPTVGTIVKEPVYRPWTAQEALGKKVCYDFEDTTLFHLINDVRITDGGVATACVPVYGWIPTSWLVSNAKAWNPSTKNFTEKCSVKLEG